MKLVQLIYASRATGVIDLDLVQSLLSKALKNNTARGISGFLAFDHSYFLQALEGGSDAVSETFLRIARDTRHHSVRLISHGEIAHRFFQHWAMGDCDVGGVESNPILQFMPTRTFQPLDLSAASALGLLVHLDELRRDKGECHSL